MTKLLKTHRYDTPKIDLVKVCYSTDTRWKIETHTEHFIKEKETDTRKE